MTDSVLSAHANASSVFLTPPTAQTASTTAPRVLRLDSRSLVISSTMFAVGVLGNLVAVAVLCVSKREQKETTFYTLVCGMAVTDLLGTCFTSPVVIATYVAGRWPGGVALCHFFSFSMLFFGSAGMSILCAMAVERYLAISHAFFYSQHVDRTVARLALLAVYLVNGALCAMPSFGFGRHAKHFPGTWCFLDWRALDARGAAYTFLYGGFVLVLIAVTVLCNCAVCRSLVGMNKKTRVVAAATRAEAHAGHPGSRRAFRKLPAVTSAAEIQMFWLLIFMTIVFLVCSIPLVVRIFANQLYGPAYIAAGMQPDYRSDLLAIRFASFNPILDPWVYILCRKNLFSKCCEWIKRTMDLSRESPTRRSGWVLGQNSPPSLVHSNATSYASLRATSCRNAVGKLSTISAKSYVDLSVRQAWDLDTAVDDFHPFSVNQSSVLGSESETASGCEMMTMKTSGCVQETSCSKVHEHKAVIVRCSFSTPSSCMSDEC
ncbi:prostaglandin E receptor 4 (subtype EP4) c [Silurus asotus]|uniref:Prostaglandin E receptor 4 (Subtype EP4) c n=1 Tax=Silurus asotus TaxID=30991 RepID=A0AAD5FAJ2_SILAS|nr:prostaglandin E receptor 4 (subtype EP4) c [Silurus asotus]